MVIIEQIGSYAGLAAILGLAVLAALYFSQARDLRRLREEAEERPVAAPAGTTVRPVPRQAPGKQAPAGPKTPPPRPAGAQPPAQPKPAGAGAAPAAASAGAAPAAASAAAPSAPSSTAQGAPGQAPPDGGKQGAAAAPAKPTTPPKPTTPGQPAPPKPTAQPRPGPPPPSTQPPKATPSRAAPIGGAPPAPGQPRTLRASTGTTGRPSWYQRLAPRYLALLIVGVLILGLGVAYGVVSLVGDDPPAPIATEDTRGGGGGDRADSGGGAPVDPSDVVVSILNGTNVPGLAAEIGDTIEAAGFQRGNVANASNQESAESVVLYVDGEADAAREVGRELDISQIQPIDAENESLAGDATVVVIVGADQAQ